MRKATSIDIHNFSHQFRIFLTGILGGTELLNHTNLSSPQKTYVDILKKSANSLLKMANGLTQTENAMDKKRMKISNRK